MLQTLKKTPQEQLREVEERLSSTKILPDDKAKTRRSKIALIERLGDKRMSLKHQIKVGPSFGPGDQMIVGSIIYKGTQIKDVKDLMYLDRFSSLKQTDPDVKMAIRKWLAMPANAAELEKQWAAKFGKTIDPT